MWLVHQWLSTRRSMWASSEAPQTARDAAALLDGPAVHAAPAERPDLVVLLLRVVGAGPADTAIRECLARRYFDDRWRGIASVLSLAGILAADVRRLPSVIADHVGTRRAAVGVGPRRSGGYALAPG
jgi:hypothetical protein